MRSRLALILLLLVPLLPTGSSSAASHPTGPTPRAACLPGGRPEPALQGQFPKRLFDDGSYVKGLYCNVRQVGTFGSAGGYRVERYVDAAGHECAYYDSTLLFPGSAIEPSGPGVYVLDMSDPRRPRLTARLTTPAMLSPHESLRLNQRRGLLAAGMGSPGTQAGFVDVYDVTQDCRAPVLRSSTPLGIVGHESAWAPDGRTFYVTGTAAPSLVALDMTDPTKPVPVWSGPGRGFHGMNLSDDGKTLYAADASTGRRGLTVLDVTEVQQRVVPPTVTEISHLTWPTVSIPQNADPVVIKGRPYLIEVDEYNSKTLNGGAGYDPTALVGAGRVIDISDPARPVVVSELRLQVHETAARQGPAREDPGATGGTQGYAGHYCSVPTRKDPTIVACSFIASGLRVFDIRDPRRPREVAYFNKPDAGGGFAMSAPAFVPSRQEVWFADGNNGFFVLQLLGPARMGRLR